MNSKNMILIVDDVEINRAILADMLGDEYDILEAADGVEAVKILQKSHLEISLVLLDLMMPRMDGFEVLAMMNKAGWIENTPVITISSENAPGVIDHAYDLGATDYINRPFDEKTVQRRVRNTIMLYNKQKMLKGIVTEQILEKQRNNQVMVEILSNIVEFRNGESGLHVIHIRMLTEIFLRKLMEITDKYQLTATQIGVMVNASALHDIGKISIPEHILNKPGRLTQEEFEVIKTHSAIGAKILEDTPYHSDNALVSMAHDICRWHHERWDGRGYPDGLKGDEIPICVQVVTLADVYDALVSERVYKPAYSHVQAMEMILNGECGAFNPLLMKCLVEVGPHLEKEIKSRSGGSIDALQTRKMAEQLIAEGTASSRTLALLEQERIKYQFFASLSNEIQFEMDFRGDMLTLPDGIAEKLGMESFILHPAENPGFLEVFSLDDYHDLCARLHKATQNSPQVDGTYRLHINGETRWHKVVARPLWSDSDTKEPTGAIGKFSDIHENYVQMEKLRMLAEQDSLTGLYNQRSGRENIEYAFSGLDQNGKALFLFMDIDEFGLVNKEKGHLFGDQVLKDISRKLKEHIRPGSIAARLGGDEFLVFQKCEGDPEQEIQTIFQSVCGVYRGFELRISMGAAIMPACGTTYDELFQAADRALYSAKTHGKNQYRIYDNSMEPADGNTWKNGKNQ